MESKLLELTFSQSMGKFMMSNVTQMLSSMGTPPREVCLDWAWQLYDLAGQGTAPPLETHPRLTWQDFEVNEEGELQLQSPSCSGSADLLIKQLIKWIVESDPKLQDCAISNSNERVDYSELERLTAAIAPRPTAIASDADTSFSFPKRVPSKSLTRSPRGSASLLAHLNFGSIKQHWLPLSLCGSALAFGSVAWWMISPSKPSPREVAGRPAAVEDAGEAASDSIGVANDSSVKNATSSGNSSNTANTPQETTLEELATIPTLGAPSDEQTIVSESSKPMNVDLAGLLPKQTGEVQKSAGQLDVGQADVDHAEPGGQAISQEMVTPANAQEIEKVDSTASDQSDTDVVLELTSVAEASESQAIVEAETEMVAAGEIDSAGENGTSTREPLILSTSPLLQTFKLPPKSNLRLKEPVWTIQLSVDSEFHVSPSEPQVISDKQPVTWLISNIDAKSPKAVIVIQSQGMPGRQTGLRWRVFASAEDLPALVLPMDDELLPKIQQRIRNFVGAAQVEVEQMKQMIAVAAKEDRAGLSKQRTALNAQLKLATRITTIAAEAKMLGDLLRDQVTVYATLRDGEDPDAPIALQFGDYRDATEEPEQLDEKKSDAAQPTSETSEPKDDPPESKGS